MPGIYASEYPAAVPDGQGVVSEQYGIRSANGGSGTAWTLVTPDAGWPVRAWHSSVVMPDGSIVMMGGMGRSFSRKNDVWRSADNGTTWKLVNPHADWSPRYGQSSVVMPDGSIVVMGGYQDDKYLNDTWRSTDMGMTWTQMSAGSPWPARWQAGSVVLPDGSILLMGGGDRGDHNLNDTWRSSDYGATWTPVTPKAGWPARRSFRSEILSDGSVLLMGGADSVSPRLDVKDDTWRSTDGGKTWSRTGTGAWGGRYDFSSVSLPDGSILLMGGVNTSILRSNDIWRSSDYGETWSLVTASAPWSPRYGHSSVMIPDGRVVLTGGSISDPNCGDRSDVWRFQPDISPSPYNAFAAGDDTSLSVQWSQITPAAEWPERVWHCSVTLPDDSIVIMGGMSRNSRRMNDVWRSTDNGRSWTLQTDHAGWSGRMGQNCVALADGSIVVMGGSEQYYSRNDTWRSTDNGKTWTRVSKSPAWTARRFASSVVMPDGTILLMGGYTDEGTTELNDIWKSADKGATWQLVNPHAAWLPRRSHTSVALQDGSIVLTGGFNLRKYRALDDTWRSTDYGVSWNMVNSGTWPARYDFTSVVLPDDSIVLMGGASAVSTWRNDVWQSRDRGTTWQQLKAASVWPARWGQSSIATRNSSIIVMGGSVRDWQDGGLNDIWMLTPEVSSFPLSAGTILVTKKVQPYSLKKGTDARVSITVMNKGKTPVHDVEILDTTLPEFPVIDGTMQYTASTIEPGDARILTYQVHATKAGSYRFNKTTVMYAGPDGNYRMAYSGYADITVLESLLGQEGTGSPGFFQEFIDWISRL